MPPISHAAVCADLLGPQQGPKLTTQSNLQTRRRPSQLQDGPTQAQQPLSKATRPPSITALPYSS